MLCTGLLAAASHTISHTRSTAHHTATNTTHGGRERCVLDVLGLGWILESTPLLDDVLSAFGRAFFEYALGRFLEDSSSAWHPHQQLTSLAHTSTLKRSCGNGGGQCASLVFLT